MQSKSSSWADLLAALGKPVALENGDLVRQLFDDGLITVDLSAHGIDLRQQLRCECTRLVRCHLVEIGRRGHGPDFTKADRLQQ